MSESPYPSHVEGDKLIIDLPGDPAGSVSVTKDIPWYCHEEASAVGQKETDEGYVVTNIPRFLGALVRSFSGDEDTRGQVHDRSGKTLIPFAPDVIARHASRDDIQTVARELGKWFYPEIFGPPLALLAESAEGEVGPPDNANPAEGNDPDTASPSTKTKPAKPA